MKIREIRGEIGSKGKTTNSKTEFQNTFLEDKELRAWDVKLSSSLIPHMQYLTKTIVNIFEYNVFDADKQKLEELSRLCIQGHIIVGCMKQRLDELAREVP